MGGSAEANTGWDVINYFIAVPVDGLNLCYQYDLPNPLRVEYVKIASNPL